MSLAQSASPLVAQRVSATAAESGSRPAGSGSARAWGRGTAARRMPPTASELGQFRAWHRDPHPARAEIDDQGGGVILDTDDPAEAMRIVRYLVMLRELLGRRSGRSGAEGTRWQDAPGGGAGRFHHYQYAPRRSSSQWLGAGQ